MNYHAHVYFELSQTPTAEAVLAKARLKPELMRVYGLVNRKVGPHAKPMFEIHFHEQNKKSVLEWLDQNRQGLSVLVHQDSGDDIKDHTDHVLWLGEKLPIDFGFFDLVMRDPSKLIHK